MTCSVLGSPILPQITHGQVDLVVTGMTEVYSGRAGISRNI
jgi:hypothetical protein